MHAARIEKNIMNVVGIGCMIYLSAVSLKLFNDTYKFGTAVRIINGSMFVAFCTGFLYTLTQLK